MLADPMFQLGENSTHSISAAAGLVHQIKPIIVLPQGVASDDRPARTWAEHQAASA